MKRKKIVFFIIIVVSIFIISNMVQSIISLSQKTHLVTDAKNELQKQKKENQELKKELGLIEKPQFVEEEARNKLFLAKPGEGVIVISKDELEASSSSKPKPPDTRPNWKKWWDMFF